MMPMDFVIESRPFRAERLNAKQQFHLSRKLAPLLPALAPLIMKLAAAAAEAEKQGLDGLMAADVMTFMDDAVPFAEALASMKDTDADAIFEMTLTSVKTETAPNVWMPLWIMGATATPVIELNDFAKLLPIILKVLTLNLGNFIAGFLTRREGPAQKSSGENFPAARVG